MVDNKSGGQPNMKSFNIKNRVKQRPLLYITYSALLILTWLSQEVSRLFRWEMNCDSYKDWHNLPLYVIV